MKKPLTIRTLFAALVCCLSGTLTAQSVPISWQPVAPGIWKGVVGTPERFDLLGAAGVAPRMAALARLGSPAFPLAKADCVASLVDGKVYLRFPLDTAEQIYGLGLHFKTVNQRGRVLHLHVDHYGGTDNGRTHAPVPFYVSDRGYGVLVNSARYITAYVGTAVRKDSKHPPAAYDRNTDRRWTSQPYSDAVEMEVPAPGTEIYVFAGRDPMEVVQRYNLFSGGGVLPPKWGLGFMQRVPKMATARDVEAEVTAFHTHGFPLDMIGLEPGWQSKAYPCTFQWDTTRFPHPGAMVKDLLAKHVRINLWLNPYLSPASPLYPEMKALSGSHTVWNGLVPDFNLAKAREDYKKLFERQHIELGVSGYKIDEIDGYDRWLWPDLATFPSGATGEQMRQRYGLLMQRMTTGWFRERNQRTYGLIRASNAGASSFPYVIYDDYYSHQDFITALCNSSFIGVLWTPEVRSSKTAEEWLRRMQSVCFSPLAMINAWADGTKPWSYPEVAPEVRDVVMLRMKLFPYLYTSFSKYYFEGKPPIRAMYLAGDILTHAPAEKGKLNSTANPYEAAVRNDIKDQFMLGDYLLVAPMFTGEKSRTVILPQGRWYDFYTGKYVGDGTIITVSPGLGKIPLFVKDGGIIPMIPEALHTPEPGEVLPLEVRHYGESPGSYALYDDDGETYDYQKGQYLHYELSARKTADGNWNGSVRIVNPQNMKVVYKNVHWKFM
jgi:alpha-D-xyloside xylohydrolase